MDILCVYFTSCGHARVCVYENSVRLNIHLEREISDRECVCAHQILPVQKHSPFLHNKQQHAWQYASPCPEKNTRTKY